VTITLRTFRGGAHKTAFLFPLFRCQARAALRTSGSIFAQRINKPEKNARLLTSMHEIISKFRTSANHTIRFYFEKNLLRAMGVARIFSRGAKSGFFQGVADKIFPGGPTVVKFNFTDSKTKRKVF